MSERNKTLTVSPAVHARFKAAVFSLGWRRLQQATDAAITEFVDKSRRPKKERKP